MSKLKVWNVKFTTILVPCKDTDAGRSDNSGDSCNNAFTGIRYDSSMCGRYDDDDFKSNLMCCVCGGGTTGNWMINDECKNKLRKYLANKNEKNINVILI